MKLDRFIGEVQKPGRYTGGEWSEVVKTGEGLDCRLALAYPDVYEVGMSHLGSRILYEVANRRADTACERVFLPWPDRQAQLVTSGRPLVSLETQTPLSDFHLLGITLQHELNYPGVVKLLDLGHIPARAAERDERHPLVIGGGPCAAAPEPVAPFFDALAIGDGEEVLEEIIEAWVRLTDGRSLASKAQRDALLGQLAQIEGIYVPALHEEGRRVRRRVVADLDAAPYPLRPIVPFLEIIHDRAQLEINRGCTHGCRFCQAGMLYRPVRQRSLETLRRQAREILGATGYEQLSLSSLSCTDYPHIVGLVDAVSEEFGDQRVSVSLPSLRTDQFGVELAQRVSRARRSPVTLAPEAGSQRLRDVINKNVTEENLQAAARAAFRAGWHAIKLYFMIGLPTETDEDVRAIAATIAQVAGTGRQELGKKSGRLRIAVTVACFVPKPHTVFELEPQCPTDELQRRQRLLREAIRDRAVDVKLSSPEHAALEGLLARGDRNLAAAIEQVARGGEGLESWHDWFSAGRWDAALGEAWRGGPPQVTAAHWAHIDTGVTQGFLARERDRAVRGETAPDCREGGCLVCGLQECCPVAVEPAPLRPPRGEVSPPPKAKPPVGGTPVCRAILTFAKEGPARYLSHLDLSRALQRALRRAGLPVCYTQGFHQRPRMTIARPLPLGATGSAELCAIDLYEEPSALDFARALHAQMPRGMTVREVRLDRHLGKAPFGRLERAEYTVRVDGSAPDDLRGALATLLAVDQLNIERESKRGPRTVDIRPGICAAEVSADPPGLHLELACDEEYMVKPAEVINALNRILTAGGLPGAAAVEVHRVRLMAASEPAATGRPERVTHA